MNKAPTLGGELLRLVTAGMYDNPLIIYREYVQNSADAIAAQGPDAGSVQIKIDPAGSQITILDDGTGLTPDEAVHCLIDLGQSPKDRSKDRGFRGIGRLSGLAFAEELHFTTRTCESTPPIRVSWNIRALRELDLTRVDAKTAIEKCISTSQVSSGEWPKRFFQVSIERVNRHATSTLLNKDSVRSYLGEVCPVPMAEDFPLAAEVHTFLKDHTDYMALHISIDDDPIPVQRPFRDVITLTRDLGAPYESIETRIIPRIDGEDPAAVLWLAHTPYSGSIPGRLGIRGLRARIGNMQIGTDRIFEHLFLESRFNGWCIGEIHILDSRIVPNGRRDYFEPGPHLRNLENHIGAVATQISSRCRRASSHRNKLRNIDSAINRLKAAHELIQSGYLCSADAIALIERERFRLPAIRQTIALLNGNEHDDYHEVLALCGAAFDAQDFNPEPAKEIATLNSLSSVQNAFGTISRSIPPDGALDLIESIIKNLSDDSLNNRASKTAEVSSGN